MLDSTTNTLIRTAINDPDDGSTLFTNEEIADIYESLNNKEATIAYFFLVKAAQLTAPTAPTAPTISDNPTSSYGYWDKKISHDLALFAQEMALYREEMAQVRSLSDIYRAQAQIFLEAAKGGDFS